MTTLEHRIRHDHGLTIGVHLVKFTHQDAEKLALVRITARGTVHYLVKPEPEDMYTSWCRATGDKYVREGEVMVWASRAYPELMARFNGAAPAASIPVKLEGVAA